MSAGPLARLVSDVPVLGPIGIAASGLTTASSPILAADNVRHGIYFHNPGSQTKRVAPAGMALAGGSGGIAIYPQSEWFLFESDETPSFNVNAAWNAVTDNNSDGTLTILNFTDNNPNAVAPEQTMQQSMGIPAILSPNGIGIATLGTTSIPVITANPSRRGIIFHNPGSVLLAVSAANLVASIGAGSIVILPGQEKRIIGNRRIKINCGWNGIAQSGPTNALTIVELLG